MRGAGLIVRDRPWALYGGWVLIGFGALMLGMTLLMSDRNPRSRETTEVVRWVSWAMLGLGALGLYRGRAARYEPSTRQLLRGGVVVHDLTRACGIAIYRPIERSPAHYVMLIVGEPDPSRAEATTFEQLRRDGDQAIALAEGVPPGAAKRAALRWRDALQVPIVLLPGVLVELDEPPQT